VSVLRANLNMRAIAVEPGSHTIVLAYSPAGLRAGASVTLLSALALLALALVRRPGRRRS
jgi:uncharacterized membrane protein YfhO